MNTLTRTLKTGCVGKDVEGCTRAMLRYLDDGTGWRLFVAAIPTVRRTWGIGKTRLAKRCAAKAGLPQYGVMGAALETALRAAGAFDLKANQLLDAYAESVTVKLVEPNQGWGSLHESLWDAYSVGRTRQFDDLGTYVDKPGDHGIGPPCYAFDLGRPDRFLMQGWDYLAARRLALHYVANSERLNIGYVILGRRIWTRDKPYWHPLTTGDTSHDFHLHISGVR